MAATIEAIQPADGVIVLSALAVLSGVDTWEELDFHVATKVLEREIGATDLVQGTLTESGNEFTLEYRGLGKTIEGVSGKLRGNDPLELSAELARLI
jgi:hypothetical protein